MKNPGHRLLFRLKCLDSKDKTFQKFFEDIMTKSDKSFTPVKPAGPEGDWKCDGYSSDSHTVFQCYAPNELRSGKTSRKIREDFVGAERNWGAKMKRWVFVWNADALPPQVVAVLTELESEYKARITIENLGTERLWTDIVAKLSSSDLDELLGTVPPSRDYSTAQLRLAGRELRNGKIEEAEELCREVLASAIDNEEDNDHHLEAYILMVVGALEKDDITTARRYLSRASELLNAHRLSVLQAQFFQLEGALLLREHREVEAEDAFLNGLRIQSESVTCNEKHVPLEDVQCFIRTQLILYLARTNQSQRGLAYAEAVETYVRIHPEAQDGHLLRFSVDALVSLAARLRDSENATKALRLLEEHCTNNELAWEGTRLLHSLTGRTANMGATDIAMSCCDLASRLAQRLDTKEDFWVAQYNAAAIYLQLGDVTEAQKRLRTLWTLISSEEFPKELKAAILSLASELAARQGEHIKAVELQKSVLSHIGAEPLNMATSSLHLGHKLKRIGRVEEAREAFETASRIGRQCGLPGEFLFDVIAPWCESEMLLGHWEEAETLLDELGTLPRPEHFIPDVLGGLREQLKGSKEIRRRIEQIERMPLPEEDIELTALNAAAVRPLLDWWRETLARATDESADGDDLSILYDYWGSGGAVEVMANLRNRSPDHFSPFIEVRTLSDIRRAIRMFSLFSDTLVLLWKGPVDSKRVLTVLPFDHVKGGAGYIFTLAETGVESATSGPWFMAAGQGAYLPNEVCRFLATEAAPLMERGRLLVLPAPAVGCWQPHHGPCENLLVELLGASLLINRGAAHSDFPVGVVPFFEDAPIVAIADILGEHPEQTRRLRLALMRKSRELHAHGSPEGASRELRDEIADAFTEWKDLNLRLARKHNWRDGEDILAAETLRFQNQWSPVFTLNRLGYRWNLESVRDFNSEATEFHVEKGTPFGSWLTAPYEGRLIAFVKQDGVD